MDMTVKFNRSAFYDKSMEESIEIEGKDGYNIELVVRDNLVWLDTEDYSVSFSESNFNMILRALGEALNVSYKEGLEDGRRKRQ